MLSYFSRRSCLLARHWFLTTRLPAAAGAAAIEAEVAASMAARSMLDAFTRAVDVTMQEEFDRAIR